MHSDSHSESKNCIDFTLHKIHYFKGQNYIKLKSEWLQTGKLFTDPYFRPINESIYCTRPTVRNIEWMRLNEINSDAKFIVNNANANDLDQGILGNCWFIAACAAVTCVPPLFSKVVPIFQTCSGKDYCGIFHFRFWIYGRWYDVVIDDYLPVFANTKQLAFCSNIEEKNEFWPALLEKAYAKVCGGCYENLEGGYTSDALIDMSGGLEENFLLKNSPETHPDLWKILVKSRQLKSMNAAYIESDSGLSDQQLPNGLVKGHAYSVTKTATIMYKNRPIKLIRLRNPWGRKEWRGPWSDDSIEWSQISQRLKDELEYKKRNEGEFWMSFEDFNFNFDSIQFCHISPDSYSDEILKTKHSNSKIKWNIVCKNGKWTKNRSGGGSGNCGDARFWQNPQFLIKLVDVDQEDNENLCTLIVALMQKHNREKRLERNGQLVEEFIQFRVFKVLNESDAEYCLKTNEKLSESQLERVGNSGNYVNKREVTKRFRLVPGFYLIIPSTFDYGIEGEFLLRFFTESLVGASEINSTVFELENEISSDCVKVNFSGNMSSSFFGHRIAPNLVQQNDKDWDNIRKEEVGSNANSKLRNTRRFFYGF